eukprot:CAMPEP_0176300688 /NCGR_PEP_ID=MMETSP0121_2-20121125/60455_1 /TAXON_ID=160619 /ORGANISM="Kryptoperidinium foliaceum, Strain CCMP 1326" /LENGTH=35 /DNA_ID= /DNA_START= /DNA_END= /DNA_ORIENTATION=
MERRATGRAAERGGGAGLPATAPTLVGLVNRSLDV